MLLFFVFKSPTKNRWINLSLKILWQNKTRHVQILGLGTFGTRKITNDRELKLFHRALKIKNFNKTVSLSYLREEYSIINNFKTKISWEFIMTSRISTLCSGCYMQVIKSLGHHLSRVVQVVAIQREVWPKNLREDHNMVVKDRWSL